MNAESLLVSASINIGFALLILTLFSILREQPSNAPIYYARSLSHHRQLSFHRRFTFLRLLPSVEWIRHSMSITEEEILDTCGLDVLIFIRLFKFGNNHQINFFLACSAVGLFLLLPLNYIAGDGGQSRYSHTMDVFTISNIVNGSNSICRMELVVLVLAVNNVITIALVVDLMNPTLNESQFVLLLLFIALGTLFMPVLGVFLWIVPTVQGEYDDIFLKRLHQLYDMRHQPNQFTVLVREIPLCGEHNARDCSVDHFFSKYHPHSYQSYQILYDGGHLEKLFNKAKSIKRKIETLRHHSLRKHNRDLYQLEALNNDAQIEKLKEILQELVGKIQHTQSKKQLREKYLTSMEDEVTIVTHSSLFISKSQAPESSLKGILLEVAGSRELSQELPVAFVTFKSRWGAALAAQPQQISNPLLWITEMAPEPRDVLWRNLAIPYRYLPLYKFGVYVAASLLTVFFAVPVTAVQGIAKFERLRKWFPPAMAVQLIPGLRSIVTGYLPSVILNGFVYVVPFAMIAMAKLAGYISRSRKDIKACNMVFYFLVGNVFFLTLLSGSLLDQIGESFSHPRDFPGRLASAASAQVSRNSLIVIRPSSMF
ncbi:hypothetical protein OROMI_014593 [Orobanche minor]